MPVFAEVSCTELLGSGSGTLFPDGTGNLKKMYSCPWESRFEVMAELTGLPEPPTYTGTARIPHQHPEWGFFYCNGVTFDGASPTKDDVTGGTVYQRATITASYAMPTYEVQGDRRLDVTLDHSQEFVPLGRAGEVPYYWANEQGIVDPEEDDFVDVPVGQLVFTTEHMLTLYGVTDTSIITAMNELQGRVNETTYRGVSPGHLLFRGGSIQGNYGTTSFDVRATLRFAQRSQSWNKVFRPGVGWRHVVHKASGNMIYALGEFNGRFYGVS